jgi:hypothetical protein
MAIAEIHKTRERISDAFGGDIDAIIADAQKRQEKSGRKTVSFAKASNKECAPPPAQASREMACNAGLQAEVGSSYTVLRV